MILISSCHQENIEYAILSGNIKNGNETIKLSSVIGFENDNKIIKVDKFGNFKDTIYTNEGLYVLFDGKNLFNLYIKPSKIYNLNYDATQFAEQGITLTGNDVDFNHYFIEKARNSEFVNPLAKKTEDEYRYMLNSIKDKNIERINESKLSTNLKEYEKTKIEYQYLFDLSMFISYAELKNPSTKSVSELDIDYNNESHFLKFGPYRRLVDGYIGQLIFNKNQKIILQNPSYNGSQNYINDIDSLVSNKTIKNQLLEINALVNFKYSSDKDQFYQDFKTHYTGTDSIFKKEMSELYSNLISLEKGVQSPVFNNYKNFEGGKTSLDDFKGKYVYINLWATWCGSCYESIPSINKYVKKYKDIKFISIAWQDDEKKWKKVVKERQFDGVQLLANADDNSFFDDYRVNSVPKYILLDKDGKIIINNPPSPSDKYLKVVLDSISNIN